MGMNPGPYGMAQTGIPFGEIEHVRDWLKITGEVGKPETEHPKRPITGFACERSEVSGRRLWGLFAEKYPDPNDFFADHFITNYCPLVWMKDTGANLTPDKLPAASLAPVEEACQAHLRVRHHRTATAIPHRRRRLRRRQTQNRRHRPRLQSHPRPHPPPQPRLPRRQPRLGRSRHQAASGRRYLVTLN